MKQSFPQTDGTQGLRANALSFPSVLMQGITHIAPAVGLVLTLQFITALAGIASPLAFGIAFLIVLMLGVSLAQLARHLPSAGGYYTYISRTLHPRAGFLAAWMYFLYDPLTAAVNLAFMGFLLQATLKIEAGINLPWWIFFLVAVLLVTAPIYRGIKISAETTVWLTIIEILIIVALAITSLLHPGDGHIQLQNFVALHNFRHAGLYLAIVFSIFTFTGFESVAPLAEETRDPRRALPRSILLSIVLMGFFFIFCSWAVLIGWGTGHLDSFVHAPENPLLLLARRLWGAAWVLVLVAVVNSILAVSIASTNACTRVFFAMGRARSLPASLENVHSRFRTPVNAILVQTLITLAIGLGVGFWIGPDQEYYFLGVAMTLGLIFIYAAGNVGVFVYYRRERRQEFRLLLHCVFPLLSTISLLWVAYKSVVPLPASPIRYAPFLVAVWLLIGVALLLLVPRVSGTVLAPLAIANDPLNCPEFCMKEP